MAINGQQDQKDPPGSKQESNEAQVAPGQAREQQGQPQQGQPIPVSSSQTPVNNHSNMESRRPQGARGTAAMDPSTRKEVARKGGMAVSRNRQHMAEIGRKGGQSVSKNREHMAKIGRKGGAASRGHH